ncbi:uncharacterized protein LOC129954140 [Eupeodes corollae]|uniref:uncharacterized protein LOC129954140 n=1 Tax=Eupeodes corollae TaxID=290404 RepID=UPI00248F79E5|nr:uncharacterized protein LOC129954140 [Eupeodes corollae]
MSQVKIEVSATTAPVDLNELLEKTVESIADISEVKGDTHAILTSQQPSDTKALQVLKTAATEDVVRLEPVKISTFEGDYLKWVNVYEMFKTLVHKNKQLQDIQRMQYLVTSTNGEARRLIENLGVTGSNYQNAWKMLFERYNNKRTLPASHLQAFFSIPNVKSETA